MFFKHIPDWLQRLFPAFIWSDRDPSRYFITFDDGPHPQTTPAVLDLLDRYEAKATFFFLGSAAERYPDLVQHTRDRGHTVGHHGFNHLSGWTTTPDRYWADVEKGAGVLTTPYFRPPYGRISPFLINRLLKQYRLVFWDYMPGDFAPGFSLSSFKADLQNDVSRSSIAVFHENKSTLPHLIPALEALLDELKHVNRRAVGIDCLFEARTT